MYDVFFLSYDEPYADEYWKVLKEQVPSARRCRGVEGIRAAHEQCAKLSHTSHFFVVDADNQVIKSEIFDYEISQWDVDYVHLWFARNPVNGLEYGWGGIKLFPNIFSRHTEPKIDMTTGFSLKIMEEVASITHFNVTPYETWRSAFRECVKLTLSDSEESAQRRNVWLQKATGANAEWSTRGALDGIEYAVDHLGRQDDLMKINNYAWLRERFDITYQDV
jgi:hypothetical protein